MPFAGSRAEADAAVAALRSLRTSAGDELILVDNQGSVTGADGVTVVQAEGERSPAHARNQGAARAGNGWILFLDADCRPSEALLDAYFAAGYAAGRAWLSRRYEGFQPHPALARAWQRSRARLSGPPAPPRSAAAGHGARAERGRFLALDALLSVDELVGFALSNRPPLSRPAPAQPPQALLV